MSHQTTLHYSSLGVTTPLHPCRGKDNNRFKLKVKNLMLTICSKVAFYKLSDKRYSFILITAPNILMSPSDVVTVVLP